MLIVGHAPGPNGGFAYRDSQTDQANPIWALSMKDVSDGQVSRDHPMSNGLFPSAYREGSQNVCLFDAGQLLDAKLLNCARFA